MEKADKEKLSKEKMDKLIQEASELLKDISIENIVEDIRKDRDTR